MKPQLEPLIPSTADFLRAKEVRLPAFDHGFHYHPEIEITCIVRSAGTRIIGDAIGEFNFGELYLLGSNLPHLFRNHAGTYLGPAVAEVLHFAEKPLYTLFDTAAELSEFAGLLDRARTGLMFSPETARRGLRHMRRLRAARGFSRLREFFVLAECLLEDDGARTLSSPVPQKRGSHAQTSRIGRCCDRILDHFTEPLPHNEMARMAGMSPSAFSRAFKQTTGKTFTQFVLEVSLGHASRQLQATGLTIAEIAFSSGFDNLSYFNRCFLKQFGTSPRLYRKGMDAENFVC